MSNSPSTPFVLCVSEYKNAVFFLRVPQTVYCIVINITQGSIPERNNKKKIFIFFGGWLEREILHESGLHMPTYIDVDIDTDFSKRFRF